MLAVLARRNLKKASDNDEDAEARWLSASRSEMLLGILRPRVATGAWQHRRCGMAITKYTTRPPGAMMGFLTSFGFLLQRDKFRCPN